MKYLKKNFHYLLFSFFFISIIFWFLEIGYSLVFRNKFVHPGTWYGPYCPIYGLAFLLIFAVFKKEDFFLINLVKISLVATSVEYTISYLSELIFKKRI